MRVARGMNQLHIDPHLVAWFLHAAFQNIGNAKLLRDLGQITGRTLEPFCGGA